jgi:hypothetical protein
MTVVEICVMLLIGFILIGLIVGYWHYIITAVAIGAAYNLYDAHGAAAGYSSIFIGWCVAFIVCSKLFGLPFGEGSDAAADYDDDRRQRIAENHRRETATRVAQHHQREFKKRFR